VAAEIAPNVASNDSVQDDLLTYDQVRRRLGLPLGTLYALVHQARIPHVRLGKRLVRVRSADIERWIAERTVIPANNGSQR